MRVKITERIFELINNVPRLNNRCVKTALRVYCGLYLLSDRTNKFGWFDVPSTFLNSITRSYPRYLKYFLEKKIIERFERPIMVDLFEVEYRRYFNSFKGVCMKYRFLEDINKGFYIDIDVKSPKKYRWYDLVTNSLLEYGLTKKIFRDRFGRRLHHEAIYNYRELFNGLYIVSSLDTEPHILYYLMKKFSIRDSNFYDIFSNDINFYEFLVLNLNFNNIEDAKSFFMNWCFGTGYTGDRIKHGVHLSNIRNFFPGVDKFIKSLKKGSYKNCVKKLQLQESSIFIDDLLENMPLDFCIPLHDAFIIKPESVQICLDYCSSKYPDLRFESKLIEFTDETNYDYIIEWDEISNQLIKKLRYTK